MGLHYARISPRERWRPEWEDAVLRNLEHDRPAADPAVHRVLFSISEVYSSTHHDCVHSVGCLLAQYESAMHALLVNMAYFSFRGSVGTYIST
jgi:hypothetical protein